MSTQKHSDIMQLRHLIMTDCDQPFLTQAVNLIRIMDNITETVQYTATRKLLLGLAYSRSHSETESGVCINLYQRQS